MILCGGGGERLWPLSRKKKPKQFINFLNNSSLLEQTINRIKPLIQYKKNLGIIINNNQSDLILESVLEKIGFVLKEPALRNTAPAVLYSCFHLKSLSKDAVVVFLPADSFVTENEKYCHYLEKAIKYASENEKIVTLGVMPTYPATGYGYIQAGLKDGEKIICGNVYDTFKFHEKPDLKLAEDYIQKEDMFWNIAVFISKVSVFLNEFEKNAPFLFNSMKNFLNNDIKYEDIKNISIDYAVMEKSKNVAVLPCDFEWSDVGNLEVFLRLQSRLSENKNGIKIINVDSENNLVHITKKELKKDKAVIFLGVEDICLVEDDNVILVAKRGDVEKVKKVLKKLREESLDQFL